MSGEARRQAADAADDDDGSLFDNSLPVEFSDTHEDSSELGKLDNDANTAATNSRRRNFDAEAAARDASEKESANYMEKQQLLHELHLHKIELSKKAILIDNMKADQMSMVEDLEEKLADAEHQRKLLESKLESQHSIYAAQQEESRKRHDAMRQDLEEILRRQQDLENINHKLQQQAGDIRRNLVDLSISEEQYYRLRAAPEESLSLKDYILLRFHLHSEPLIEEAKKFRDRFRAADEELHHFKTQYEIVTEKLSKEHKDHTDLIVRFQKQAIELKETHKSIQHGNYKIDNFDKLQQERDHLEADLLELKKSFSYLDASHRNVTKDRDDATSDLAAAKQSISLLQRDKEYLTLHGTQLEEKLKATEEKLASAQALAENMQRLREEMYEKYVASRDQYKSEYERKVREEVEELRGKLDGDMERLKLSMHDTYERENRQLKEAKEAALADRERAVAAEREIMAKYNSLLDHYQKLQFQCEARISNVQAEAKIKLFEAEHTMLTFEDSLKQVRSLQADNEKQSKKIEVLTKEFFDLQVSSEKKVAELQSQVKERDIRLQSYEKLESELDDVVMQAAELQESPESDDVLSHYGYSAKIPSETKRRLQQSVHLARRVLNLERQNTSLNKQLEHLQQDLEDNKQKLEEANGLLSNTDQPYNFLVEKVRTKDQDLRAEKQSKKELEERVNNLVCENRTLAKQLNKLQMDLERLLTNRRELSHIREVVQSLVNQDQPFFESSFLKKSPENSAPKIGVKEAADSGVIMFTKEEKQPAWFAKLSQNRPAPTN